MTEKKTIYDCLLKDPDYGRHLLNHTGNYGIEIETECLKAYDIPAMALWNIDQEELSLRNFGVEYILNCPMRIGEELDTAFEEFETRTKDITFIEDSISTSTHVHINMMGETWITLANFMTLYSLFENVLIKHSGPTRHSNLFSLPIRDAEATLDNIIDFLTYVGVFNYRYLKMSISKTKYAALNLAAFGQLGSLEVRSFRGTADISAIKNWIETLNCLLKYSRQEELTPRNIVKEYLEGSPTDYLEKVFKEYAGPLLNYDDVEEMIERNLGYIARIASSQNEWNADFGIKTVIPDILHTEIADLRKKIADDYFSLPYDDLSEENKHVVDILLEEDLMLIQYKEPQMVNDMSPYYMGPSTDTEYTHGLNSTTMTTEGPY